MNLILLFIILNVVNVVLMTTRTLVTVKCGKWLASSINAIAFGFYTVVIVYTMCNLPLMLKTIIVTICNFIGVMIVKLVQEKARKDKIWKIEISTEKCFTDRLMKELKAEEIPTFIMKQGSGYNSVVAYCYSQKHTEIVKELGEKYKAKFFISETKNF